MNGEFLIGQFGTSLMAEPTPLLRWHKGMLQQQWRIAEWRAAMNVSNRTEWREVPVDDESP